MRMFWESFLSLCLLNLNCDDYGISWWVARALILSGIVFRLRCVPSVSGMSSFSLVSCFPARHRVIPTMSSASTATLLENERNVFKNASDKLAIPTPPPLPLAWDDSQDPQHLPQTFASAFATRTSQFCLPFPAVVHLSSTTSAKWSSTSSRQPLSQYSPAQRFGRSFAWPQTLPSPRLTPKCNSRCPSTPQRLPHN